MSARGWPLVLSRRALTHRMDTLLPLWAYDTRVNHPWHPDWIADEKPAWVRQHVGAAGLPATMDDPEGLGEPTRGVDLWQARNFVGHNEDTHEFLYGEYTADTPVYHEGTLPQYETVVDARLSGIDSRRKRAVTLLTEVVPDLMAHPGIPPVGRPVPNDRALDDRQLIATGCGYCNEQARLFVRLCQVAGIPARIVFLFYLGDEGETTAGGHVVAEFATAEGWAMADTSYFTVFPDDDGGLLSAAECHRPENQERVRDTYARRGSVLHELTDEELVGRRFAHLPDGPARREAVAAHAGEKRPPADSRAAEWGGQDPGVFGIQNYPLPPADWQWD